MELKLENGDYLPDGHGGLQQAEEELLQRVLSRLSARRGSFPFLPDFGSRLWAWLHPRSGRRRRNAM